MYSRKFTCAKEQVNILYSNITYINNKKAIYTGSFTESFYGLTWMLIWQGDSDVQLDRGFVAQSRKASVPSKLSIHFPLDFSAQPVLFPWQKETDAIFVSRNCYSLWECLSFSNSICEECKLREEVSIYEDRAVVPPNIQRRWSSSTAVNDWRLGAFSAQYLVKFSSPTTRFQVSVVLFHLKDRHPLLVLT